ncbi:MAG: nuclear transport factor 2 family protein [bacterium]
MSNSDIIRAYYESLANLDMPGFKALHLEDVEYHISGHTIISGRYKGLSHLEAILPLVFDALDFNNFQFAKRWKIICEQGDTLVAMMEADGLAKTGKRYDQRYVQIFTFRDGKIAKVMEFFDTALAIEALGWEGLPSRDNDGSFEF